MLDLHPNEACAATAVLFENAEWRLSGNGLEHRGTGYFIARDLIGMRRGDLWEWPMHLAEKSWCSARSFRQAFLTALEAYGLSGDASLTRSFAVGFGLVAAPASRSTETDDFVALGDLVRPRPTTATKSVSPPADRKRAPMGEARAATRRIGAPMSQVVNEAMRQRATS